MASRTDIGKLVMSLVSDDAEFRKGLQSSLQHAERSMKKMGAKLTRVGAGLSAAVTAPLAGVAAVSLKAFAEQEKAEASLQAALRATGQEAERNTKRFKAQAAAIQRVTTVGDEESIALAAMAVNMGITSDRLDETVKGAIGLSKAFKMDLQTSIKASSAALQGKTELLTRYIPTLSQIEDEAEKVAFVQRKMAEGFEVAQAEAKTTSGQMIQMKNAVGDLAETIGAQLAPILTPLVQKIRGLVERLGEADPRLVRMAVAIGGVVAAAGPAVVALGLFVKGLGIVAGAVATVAGAISAPVVAAFAAIVAAGVVIAANWEQIKAGALALKDRVVTAFNEWKAKNEGTLQALGEAFGRFWAKVKEVFGAIVSAVQEISKVVYEELDKILEPVGGVQGALEKLATHFAKVATVAFEMMAKVLDAVVKHLPTVVEHISGVIRMVSTLIQKFLEMARFVKESVEAMVEAVSKQFGRLKKPFDDVVGWIGGMDAKFRALWKNVVGGSYVPDMVDGLIAEGKRMQTQWVNPSVGSIGTLEGALRTFADRTADYLTGVGGQWESFGDVVKSVVRDMANSLVKSGLHDLINGLVPGGRGQTGGIFGRILGGIGSLFGGFRAGGGPVERGRAYVVGEGGAETFVPGMNGTVLPGLLGFRMPATAGGPQVVVNQNFEAGVDESRLALFARDIQAKTEAGVLDAIERGGAYRRRAQR